MGKNGFTYRVLQKYSIKFEGMISLLLKFCQNHFGFLIISVAIVAAVSGCDAEEPCASRITNRFRINFLAPGPEEKLVAQPFFFKEVKAIGALRPSFPVKGEIGTTSLSLSLDPNSDTTTYVFYYGEDQQDTLQLAYKRNSRMISTDCDLEITFKDVVLLKTPFVGNEAVSVEVRSNEISDKNTDPNLEIVRRAACTPVETNRLRLGFFKIDSETGEEVAETRTFKRVSRKSNNEVYFPLTPNQAGVEELVVKLNPEAKEVTYIFEYQSGESDVLALRYNRKFDIESFYCIPDVHYEEITVMDATNFALDTVQVVTPAISEPTEQINVKIIRK